MIETYAAAYLDQLRAFDAGEGDAIRLTLDNTDGVLHPCSRRRASRRG